MSYSSTLISFVSSPNRNPIIESVEDIPKVPGLQIVVDKGYTIEYVILVISKTIIVPTELLKFMQLLAFIMKIDLLFHDVDFKSD